MIHLPPLRTPPPWIPCSGSVSAGPLVFLWAVCMVHMSHRVSFLHSSILRPSHMSGTCSVTCVQSAPAFYILQAG